MKYNLLAYTALAIISRIFYFFVKPFLRKKDILLLSHSVDRSLAFNAKLALNLNGSSKVVIEKRLNTLIYTLLGKPKFTFKKSLIKPLLRASYGRGLGVHQPKLIIHMQDSSSLSAAIKKYSGAKLVNIAHGVTGATELFNVIDFDYYFIYGDSSIEHLLANKGTNIHCGSTQLVKVGPLMSEYEEGLRLSDENIKIINSFKKAAIYSSAFTRASSVQELLSSTHKLIIDFAVKNPDTLIIVTLHPAETISDFWHNYISIKNLLIINSGYNKNELASYASIHLTMASNSVIDYGLRGLDSIIIRYNDYADEYLQFSKFFTICSNADELAQAMNNYSPEQSKLQEFLSYHCEYTDMNTFNRVVENLNKILAGKELQSIPFHIS